MNTRLTNSKIVAISFAIIMLSSSFIMAVDELIPAGGNQIDRGTKSDPVLSDVTPPEAIWTHVYDGYADSDNKFESVTQLDNGDFVATGGQMASHAGQPQYWDWYTVSDSNPEVGSNDGHDWDEYYGWTDSELALSVAAVPGDDDVVVSGYYMGNERDIRVRRLDETGQEVWVKLFTEAYDQIGYQVIPTNDGDFVVTGRYQNGSGWPYDFVLIKITDDGFESWRKGYGGSGAEEAYSVAECSNGDFVIAGYTTSLGGSDKDLWVVRVDSTGNEIWNQFYGGDFDDWGRHIVECEDGGFAITGSTKSNGGSDEDLWVVRLNSTGHLEWEQYYGGASVDYGLELVECTGGGFAVVGTTQSYGNGGQDVWLLRTNSTGYLLWSNEYGGSNDDTGNSIVKTQDGGFVIAGGSRNWGGGDMDAFLLHVADPPVWLKEPSDQAIMYGEVMNYQLEATATYIDAWWSNDTNQFSVDENGLVSNTAVLPQGYYGLQVWLNDTLGNTLSGTFTVEILYMPFSESVVWQRTYGGDVDDHCMQVIRLQDGGYGLAGYGESFGSGQNDGWLARSNEFGILLWNRTFGDATQNYITSLFECSNGDFVIAGATDTQSNGFQAWIIRTDSSGGLLWDYDFGGIYTDNATSVIESSDGGIVVAGSITSGSLDRDLWIFRLNSTGHLNWSTTVTSAYHQEGISVIERSTGGYVIAGYTDSGAAITTREGMLYGVNSDGSFNWSYVYSLTQNELWDVVECSNGDFAATGYIDTGGASRQVHFIRVNSGSGLQDEENYGGTNVDYGASIVQTRSGGFAILGTSYDSVGGDFNALLVRTPFNGSESWSTTYGGDGDDRGSSIIERQEGGYTIAGSTSSWGIGGEDIWVFRAQPVRWVSLPEDQIIEYGEELNYDLEAELLEAGLGAWLVNNTGNFTLSVSGNATLANNTIIKIGTYGVNLDLTDVWGDFLNRTITVTIAPPLPPEWVTDPMDQYVEFGDPFEYDLDAIDVAGVDGWQINDTDDFTIDRSGRIQNGTILPVGTFGLQVDVNDTLGNVTTAAFNVYVDDTTPPTLNITPVDQFLEYGIFFSYAIGGWDYSGIDSWWLNDTTHFTVDGNGTITEKHTLPVVMHQLTLYANDTEGNTQSADFTVIVSIDPPTWLVEPSEVFAEYTHDFRYVTIVSSEAGIASWGMDDTTNFAIDQFGIITNTTPLEIGVYPLSVNVTDIWGQTSGVSFDVIVRDTVAPFLVDPPTNVTIEYDDYLVIEITATDPSGISHWSINNTNQFGVTSIGRIINVTVLVPGLYWLSVTVYDIYGNSRSAALSLDVTETQIPQWYVTPDTLHVEFGSDLEYELEAYDLSGIASWKISDPFTFDISDDGVLTNVLPLSLGTYELEITVIDGVGNSDTVMVDVIVQDTTPPTWIIAPVNQGVQYGESVYAQFAAWDLSGIGMWTVDDTVQFRINAVGLLESTANLRTGVHYLNISVLDTQGNMLSSVITVIVQSVEAGGPDVSLALAFVGVITGGVVVIMSLAFCIVRKRGVGESK